MNKRTGLNLLRSSAISLILCIITMVSLSQTRRFTILHTTDEHSTLMPLPMVDYDPDRMDPALGGYARLATLVNEIREQKDDPVLLFSSGDFIGGTPFAWLILEGYSPEIHLKNLVGYDAVTIGNHEFDYGPDLLAEYLLNAGYPELSRELPVIASNLDLPADSRLHETGIFESMIFELENGINLGVFGILGEEAYSLATQAEPAGITDPRQTARNQVSALREAGVDIIVALTHAGMEEDRRLAREVEGIDIILGGHDHIPEAEPVIVNGTYIMHSGYYLQYLGHYEFEWDPGTRELSLVDETEGYRYILPVDSRIEEDPRLQEVVLGYVDLLNEFVSEHTRGLFTDVGESVAWSDFPLVRPSPFTETQVGNFVTDAMRMTGEMITGERVDVAFQGNGIIRTDIVPGAMDWSMGQISFFDLVTVSGLGSGEDGKAGYPLVSVYLTEREIFNVLETSSLLSQLLGDIYFLQVSGLRYVYDPGRTVWLTLPGGTPLPAYRSVIGAELYTGDGIQDTEEYTRLEKRDDRMYHVITDYYLTSFLPMVGERLPRLKVDLKDRYGNHITPEEAIIIYDQREFKTWEAIAQYATSFETDEFLDLPVIPRYYESSFDRIIFREGIPLRYWSYAFIILILVITGLLVHLALRRRRHRRNRV